MSRILAKYYDRFMSESEKHCLQGWRGELLADISGRVLEIGAGTGANLGHYPPDLEQLVVAEPDRHMRARLEALVAERGSPVTVSDAAADPLPFEDGAFDVVVSTLVLCSVPDLPRALAEIHRVLRPGGRLVFIEHVAAKRGGRLHWQRLLEPLWRVFADGCHLTRPTAEAIQAAGFELESCTSESMRKALPFVRPTVRGVASRQPQS